MRLSEFQDSFKNTMLQPVSGLEQVPGELRALFVDDDISVQDRLKIYHNNIIGSLTESLRSTFPVCENLVGQDFFKSMARAFIFENPPASGCLYFYGAGFDDFVRGFKSAASVPYLGDIATMEWAMHAAYYAADDAPLRAEALAGLDGDALMNAALSLRASAHLVQSNYPLTAIRNFCRDETQPAPDMQKKHTERLLIYRPDLGVDIVPLDKHEFFILEQLDNSTPLGQAVEKTLEIFPEFNFTAFLKKHIELETFSAFPAKSRHK